VIRSPFPDIEIPDMPLTEFVLARANERGDKPALIDAPSGRAIQQLAAAVRAGTAGPGKVFAQTDATARKATAYSDGGPPHVSHPVVIAPGLAAVAG